MIGYNRCSNDRYNRSVLATTDIYGEIVAGCNCTIAAKSAPYLTYPIEKHDVNMPASSPYVSSP